MSILRPWMTALLVIAISGFAVPAAHSEQYVAYSLGEAERMISAGRSGNTELATLGGITDPVAVVYDSGRQDLIVVGSRVAGRETVTLDDLTVALRSIIKNEAWPLVSIDKDEHTSQTRQQQVRFEGGIEQTAFGKALFEADLVLKNLTLGTIPGEIWGVRSLFDLFCDHQKKSRELVQVRSRFWFTTGRGYTTLADRPGVMVIEDLAMMAESRLARSSTNGLRDDTYGQLDGISQEFARSLTTSFSDLSQAYPELARLEAMFRLVAIAAGVGQLSQREPGIDRSLQFWLERNRVKAIATPATHPLQVRRADIAGVGAGRTVELDGGIELRALILELNDGSITALRDIVTKSRPRGSVLTWKVPLEGWSSRQAVPSSVRRRGPGTTSESYGELGTEVDLISYPLGTRRPDPFFRPSDLSSHTRPTPSWATPERFEPPISPTPTQPTADTRRPDPSFTPSDLPPSTGPTLPWETTENYRPPPPQMPTSLIEPYPPFEFTDRLRQRPSERVGGVMLSGTGQAAGQATADLSGGQFALIIDGQNARLDPAAHCRFVTSLWAVYFGNTVPGISIDPIYQDPETGSFSDKHLVRYIGRVVNTDLGRVMRETDYLMKKWSVGTERASIRGFRTPDDYSGRAGTFYASLSRFWLTPEDMTFNASDGMLLFDRGNMAVKTEVLGHAIGAKPSDPHNEAFARFFTENYDEIAEKYPVFRELSDYGKMVALSRYLKDSGIPLLWYLLAHKDDVLTEDSPGTVDNLAKESEYWRGVSVQGGVDLSDQGQFVYDETAIRAIRRAQEQYRRAGHTPSGEARHRPVVTPVSFETARNHYTVVPQHSLTSGRDRAGNRYQTDFCLRAEGYRVTDEVVDVMKAELVRIATHRLYSSMTRNLGTDEIQRRHEELLTSAYNQARRETALMHSMVDALRGREFSGEAECERFWNTVAGTDPDAMKLRRVFVQQCHYVTNLELVRYFNPRNMHGGEFGDGWRLLIPYRIRPADDEMRDFLNVRVPVRMAVENILTGNSEVLRFCTETYTAAAYVPDNLEESALLGLFLLSDASMRLSDKMGSRFEFDPAGDLVEMSLGDTYSVRFTYSDSFTDRFDEDPYYLEPVPGDWVTRGDVRIPERMRLVPVSGGEVEVFRASEGREYLGYVPEQPQKSRYEFLAIMTDASFRLIGRDGSEFAFFSNGEFDSWIRPDAERLVQSISSGAHTVDFEYTMDNTGTMRISTARVRGGPDRDDGQDLIVRYRYDDRGRLLMASR